MNILDNIFYRVTDSARQCGAQVEFAPLVALQLLAWRKVSEGTRNKLHGTFQAAINSSHRACYDQACQSIGEALETPAELPEAWAHPALQNLMLWLQEINLEQLSDGRQLTQAIAGETDRKSGYGLPQEIISLMAALAGNLSAKSVYCPFDQSFQMTVEAAFANAGRVCTEVPIVSPLPAAIQILCNLNFEYGFSNLIYRPFFRDNASSLQQFDVALCNPPWGGQVTTNHRDDTFGRFKGDERSLEHQVIRHLICQVKGTSIVLVPLSVLFGSQMGLRSLREELIMTGKLRAVISLPSGLLNSTGIASALVVIDSHGGNTNTLMIDADNQRYNTRDGRSRSRLDGWKQLRTDFEDGLSGKTIKSGRLVSHEEIEIQDFQLQVNRYLKSDSAKQVQDYFAEHVHSTLGELVEVLRPSLPAKDEGIEATEVTVSDYPPVGYVRTASKSVQITGRKNLSDLFLRPDDIVIVVKGAMTILGRAGLVGEEAQHQNWVANQMSLVLRVKSTKIDPRFLYRYLQSDLAKVQVQNLNLGSAIPNLRPNDLKAILVPLPSMEEQQKIIESFRKIVEIQDQMDELTRQRDMLSDSTWPRICVEAAKSA